jgi:hypothetical protein
MWTVAVAVAVAVATIGTFFLIFGEFGEDEPF